MAANLPLSIVVPVRDSAITLGAVLSAILASDLTREAYELIVVDDASGDGSAGLAARYADTVVRLTGGTSGPAYARNRGAELARGDVVAFVDADVLVRPDTLPRMLKTLVVQPSLDAISASHDDTPAVFNLVSQYWSLLLHFSQQRQHALGVPNMAGCAAIRRKALLSAGMYDEWHFASGCLEGVDLGMRLHKAGRGGMLSHALRVTQMKHWSLASLIVQVWHRSNLLSRSLGYQRTRSAVPTEVVFTLSEPISPLLAAFGTVAFTAAFVAQPFWTAILAIMASVVILINLPVHSFFVRVRGLGFAVAVAPLHLLIQGVAGIGLCTGWLLRDVFGDHPQDATTQAYAEVGLEIWPPVRRPS